MKAAKRKVIGIRGWVWRGVLGCVALAVLLFAIVMGFYAKHSYDQAAFDKKPLRERNLIVFDAVVKAVNERYYDPTFGGVDWAKGSQEARPKAAAAKTAFELYTNVLAPLLRQLPVSHVSLAIADAPNQKNGIRLKYIRKGNARLDEGFDLVQVHRHDRIISIVGEVRRGTAAEAAGIQPGWFIMSWTERYDQASQIMHFDGQFIPVIGDHAVVRLGSPGDGVDKPFTLTFGSGADMTAHSIGYDMAFTEPAPDFEFRRLASGARYIRFDGFKSDLLVSPFMDRVLAEIDRAGPEGMILDLRHNGGGDENQCVRFLSHFLPHYTSLGTMKGRNKSQVLRTNLWSHTYKGPLVVLIGPSTGSAAEITAQNLKYYHRATIVGRISNGAVLESRNVMLPDGGHIQLPVKDYLSPDGKRIESVGVVPDIEIIPALADIRAGRDPVLERAESLLVHK